MLDTRTEHLYVSTFGNSIIKYRNTIPLEVGAELRNNFIYELKDNQGKNISNQNKYYGELTGLYWVWKNVNLKDDELVGFFHYNKALYVGQKKVATFFKRNNSNKAWIVAKRSVIPGHPRLVQVENLEKILKEKVDLKYYSAWKEIYAEDGSARAMNPAQMFITTKKEFDKYCQFLFEVLQILRTNLGDIEDIPYFTRYCALLGERLLSVYLVANDCYRLEVEIIEKNKFKWALKKVFKLMIPNKDSKVYQNLREKFGYKSSYTDKG